MKKLFLILTGMFLPYTTAYAQWKKAAGLNLETLPAKSLELTSEWSPAEAAALTINLGYTFGTGFAGTWSGWDRSRVAGVFGKIGGRMYLLSIGERKAPRHNVFLGGGYALTSYKFEGSRHPLITSVMIPAKEPLPSDKSDFGGAAFLNAGYTLKLSPSIKLEAGFQKAFVPDKAFRITQRSRTQSDTEAIRIGYIPGIGTADRILFRYVQGIIAFKYCWQGHFL